MSESIVLVDIFDTSLRDGAQSLPMAHQFPDRSKRAIADVIATLGVATIEAGFPRTPGDEEEVQEVAATVGTRSYTAQSWQDGISMGSQKITPIITGLSRVMFDDIDATWRAVQAADKPGIHTFVSTDTNHMRVKFPGKTPDDVRKMAQASVRHARSLADTHRNRGVVEFSAEAASTTEPSYLESVIKTVVEEGADIINVPDTVGQRNPFWMRGFYRQIIGWATDINPDVVISAHNHNDLDQATANSLSLVYAASDFAVATGKNVHTQIETTVTGIGERAGNSDVFPVVAGLFKFAGDMTAPIKWNFNPGRSVEVARQVLGYAGLSIHRQSPIVGSDIMVHRSGIHSDGVIKGGHRIYTPHDPTFWGHLSDAVHEEGKYQGARGRAAANS